MAKKNESGKRAGKQSLTPIKMNEMNENNKKNEKIEEVEESNPLHLLMEQISGADVTLSAQEDIIRFLKESLVQARKLTHSEAGSLYLRYGDLMLFEIFQNDRLERENRLGDLKFFKIFHFPVDKSSLVGFCVLEKIPLRIDDVQKNPYFNRELDRILNYETKTMLALPLLNDAGHAIGCLQLINSLDGNGEPRPYGLEDVDNLEILATNISQNIVGLLKD